MISVSKFEDYYKNKWVGKIAIISKDDFYPEGGYKLDSENNGSIYKWISSIGWLLDNDGRLADYYGYGDVYDTNTSCFKTKTHPVHPTLYLKSNVQIVSSTGLSTNPYIISL